MNWGLGFRLGSAETWDKNHQEPSVLDWLRQYEPASWIPSGIVLTVLLAAILLLPLVRTT